MSSANEEIQGEDTANENTASITIYDVSDSELFVLDEVGCDSTNSTSEEDEPEIVFIKENNRSPNEDNEDDSECKVKGNLDEILAPDDDEPEVIFSSATPTAPSPVLVQEAVTKPNEDQPEIVKISDSSVLTFSNSSGNPSQAITEDHTSNSENVSSDLITEDVSGLFCLDTTPEVARDKPMGPRFRREFSSTLRYEEDAVDSTEDSAKSDNIKCFNCQGDHSLQNCPNPKNYQEISKNRSAFSKNQPKLRNRYHEDQSDRFGRFKPGVLTKELRDALGLRSSEIPLHIYQMRILGYPPGWLEEIKEYSSGLEFIDTTASISSTEKNQKITYDYDKIVEYPGFNVALSSNFRDDWRFLNFPPMQKFHSKEIFIQNLKMYSQAQMDHPAIGNGHANRQEETSDTNLDIVDMDTSIEDLEEQRKALLAELGDSENSFGDDDCCIVETSPPSLNELGENGGEGHEGNANGAVEEPATEKESVASNELNLSPKQSKLLAMGTPVSIRFSPYSTLPTRDKFARNMGELELFENLPTSTGAFQKMRSLLKKVRTIFKKK